MEDYRKKAQQKFLEQKKIKIEEDKLSKEEEEKLAKEMKEKQEQLNKIREEQTKKQVYVQSQMLIIDEFINSFKTDKTDDNIMLILTVINGTIENIQNIITKDEQKIIMDQVLKFTADVDNSNAKRAKGIDTIANLKILKEGFDKIYKLLNLNIDVQITNTDNDEQIAKELEKEINAAKHPKIKHDFEDFEDYTDDVQHDVAPRVLPPVARAVVPIARPAPPPAFMPGVVHNVDSDDERHPDDGYGDLDFGGADIDDDVDDDDDDDEAIARRIQEDWNKPHKKEPLKNHTPIIKPKYDGLNCEDFMKVLLSEKVSES
jgi:hypothetical protein